MRDYKEILFEKKGKVAVLTLNRPDSLNALTLQMMGEAAAALESIEEDKSIRALVITGAGRAFCSGQDLKNRVPEGTDIIEAIMDCYYPVFQKIRTCRVPVVIGVNGVAAGGGCSLSISGDIILASKSARFIQVFSRIGLVPDLSSSFQLPKIVGRARALEMMMTNVPIDADTAAEWGMINRVIPDNILMEECLTLAEKLAEGPTQALRMTRELVDDGTETAFKEHFAKELQANKYLRECFDSKEGVAAFIEKRPAQFRGE